MPSRDAVRHSMKTIQPWERASGAQGSGDNPVVATQLSLAVYKKAKSVMVRACNPITPRVEAGGLPI